ncbi:hypothetical protein DM01DRAFT_1302089 [Hesseltinella vesiculosa]|uniref:Arb2 domain-containing protein n=1 Tax=Hesseltinella vesiculosa TaxID=101127 RepID=A0A1X2GNW1_9FUNG|nr:hypothetical protein DM01DRAFT_1302089 [Hesseltinella vesiculosa]
MFRGKRKEKKVRDPIPTTLDGFNYYIKPDGSIRSKSTDLVGDIVEEKLQAEPLNFQKVTVPVSANVAKNDPHTYVYMTPKALTTTGKLLLLIPGIGTRVGQWNRRVMCDHSINDGSVLNVVEEAQELGYEVVIFNPNGTLWYDNRSHYEPPTRGPQKWIDVPENTNPEEHCLYVFDQFIREAKASKIGVMALGWGGICFMELLNHHFDTIKKKVVGVSLANSTHTIGTLNGEERRTWLHDHVVNWTLNEEVASRYSDAQYGCACQTAVVELPDYVIWKYAHKMLKFIQVKMSEPVSDDEEEDPVDDPETIEDDPTLTVE